MPDSSLINTFLAMMAMVAIFGGILLFVKKIVLKGKNSKNTSIVQVISKTVIQPKTSIYTIRAGSRTLLVGVTDHNITTLADLTEDSEQTSAGATSKSNFQNNLQNSAMKQKMQNPSNELSFASFLKNTFKRSTN